MIKCMAFLLQGGVALGVLAVSAQLFDMACLQLLGASLSATSLLIIVGTVMQSSRQVRRVLSLCEELCEGMLSLCEEVIMIYFYSRSLLGSSQKKVKA
jgi:hypothetical protein